MFIAIFTYIHYIYIQYVFYNYLLDITSCNGAQVMYLLNIICLFALVT